MKMNPIGWIEIPATDLDRAEKWYKDYFGFDLDRQPEAKGFTMSWFPMEMEAYGSACTLIKGEHYKPSIDGILLYFTAPEDSVTKGLEKAEKLGIEILSPRMDIGEHGFMAIIKDSEGNRIAIHSRED